MTTENPYAAPAAVVDLAPPEVPPDILKKIRYGWGAALFSCAITLVLTLVAMSGTEMLGLAAWNLLDVVLIGGLALGIYKRSRACAVIMFVYFVISKIIAFAEAGAPAGLPMAVVFCYFYWQGIAGTFAYHAFRKQTSAG